MDNILMFFPNLTKTDKSKRSSGPANIHYPGKEFQIKKIGNKLNRLEDSFKKKKAEFKSSIKEIEPEQVLVFEIVGTIEDFFKAVKKIKGFEWMDEWEEEFSPDDNFYDKKNKEKELSGRVFLVMSNQRALHELLSLWNTYQKGEKFKTGFTKFRYLFEKIKDIRPWGVHDRLTDTGVLEDWNERVKDGAETINLEVELWYRFEKKLRDKASRDFRSLVREAQGEILREVIIDEINYHAFLIKSPISIFNNLDSDSSIKLIRSDHVMYFRPVGQVMNILYDNIESNPENTVKEIDPPQKNDPIVALLDGLPVVNHKLLQNHVIVDDPDDYESFYNAGEHQHGTSMASLIINGDINANNSPLDRPIYVRPIMRPNKDDFRKIRGESIPRNELPIDIIHRAVRRIFEGDENFPPAAPNVKIINLSIGDEARQFDQNLSPWAKLIDWLAVKYNVLFIISAGNYRESLIYDIDKNDLNSLSPQDYENHTLKAISQTSGYRRLLSPSESINSLTIGAIHSDEYKGKISPRLIDPLPINKIFSPISRMGTGHRRSIKPDIFLDGGRQTFLENFIGFDGKALLEIRNASTQPPGQKVAFPGSPGELDNTLYTCGTSNSAALGTRLAAIIYEYIIELKKNEIFGSYISDQYIPLIIKTLLVHHVSWEGMYNIIKNAFKDLSMKEDSFKDKVASKFLGYGYLKEKNLLYLTNQKATVIGYNEISKGEGNIFEFPLPPSLSSKNVWRRLTITLSWFSPINPNNKKYRNAILWFDPPIKDSNNILDLKRQEGQWQGVRRGTVQHEILEGENASPFIDGDVLKIQVNCDKDASNFKEKIRYSLAVTLEVSESINIPIYEEIYNRIRPRIQISPKE